MKQPNTLRATLVLAALIAFPQLVAAQVSPIGGHHFTAGGAPQSSATGGYSASVPMAIPETRRGLPVPLRVVYTQSARAGAAGAGWDIPLSYVRESRSTRGRKPQHNKDGEVAPRLFMSLGGATQLMVPGPDSDVFRPLSSTRNLELKRVGNEWRAYEPNGTTYVFKAASTEGVSDPDFYLLKEIWDATKTDGVKLSYTALPHTCKQVDTPELLLSKIEHTPGESKSNWLYTIELDYTTEPGNWCEGAYDDAILGRYHRGDVEYLRTRKLSRVRVLARNNLRPALAPVSLREYELEYQPDPDTKLPRLEKVWLYGEGGARAERPIAEYEYGHAVRDGAVHVESTPWKIPRSLSNTAEAAALTESASKTSQADTYGYFELETITTQKLIRDFTGDGVPDQVRKFLGNFVINPGRLHPNSVSLAEAQWSMGLPNKAEVHVETVIRPTAVAIAGELLGTHPSNWSPYDVYPRHDFAMTRQVWATTIDWNGDGRLDIVDAREGSSEDHWLLRMNTPGASKDDVVWVEHQIYVGGLRQYLRDQGHEAHPFSPHGDRLPISQSRTSSNIGVPDCVIHEWTGGFDWTRTSCPLTQEELDLHHAQSVHTETITEWKVFDVNGDRYPDFVSNSLPLRAPELDPESCPIEDPPLPVDGGPQYSRQICFDRIRVGLDYQYVDDSGRRNDVVAFLNRGGAHIPATGAVFTPTPSETLLTHTQDILEAGEPCGLQRWVTGAESAKSRQLCGFADTNGDGVVERSGGIAFENNRHEVCQPDAAPFTEFVSRQTAGYLDITGDGIPDMVSRTDNGNQAWEVRIGTGVGFKQPVPILGSFELSASTGTCRTAAIATSAAADMDGDGRPELISTNGFDAELQTRSIIGGNDLAPGAPASGRLIRIGNGYGAWRHIDYVNAKRQEPSRRNLPGPEMVVGSERVIIDGGPGDGIDAVRYAYGDAERRYDPILHAWRFAGYARRVTMTGTEDAKKGVTGVVTIDDAYIRDHSLTGFDDLVLSGTTTSSYRLEGQFDPNPWAFLTVDPAASPTLRGGAKGTFSVAPLADANSWTSYLDECFDVNPYTGAAGAISPSLCQNAGIAYAKHRTQWLGDEAPSASTKNVETAAEVLAVDAYGRATHVRRYNDTRVLDDDVCIEIEYAQPTSGSRVLTAVASQRTTNCGLKGDVVFAGSRTEYDGKPAGQVGEGLPTRSIVEVYDAQGQGSLGEHVAAELSYDGNPFGLVSKIESTRTTPSAVTQTTNIIYDDFGVSAKSVSKSSDDTSTLTTTRSTSVLPSVPAVTTEPNGLASITERDPFGRRFETKVRLGSSTYTLSRTTYDDNNVAAGRSITVSAYSELGATSPDSTSIVRFDAMGRMSHRESLLGDDYDNNRLISSYAVRDSIGRVVFVADAFAQPQALAVGGLTTLPYGTTTTYTAGGDVSSQIRGDGLLPYQGTTNKTNETLPTHIHRTYDAGRAVTITRGPNELDPAHTAYQAFDRVEYTAIGRPVEHRREKGGQVLERTRYGFNALGLRTLVARYSQPGSSNGTAVWSSTYDSLGRRLTLQEPNASQVRFTYDEWGGQIRGEWNDGAKTRSTHAIFDGLGRITDRRLETSEPGMDTEVESHTRHFYDVHSGSPHQPAGSLLGRASFVLEDGVMATYFQYDSLGRLSTTARVNLQDKLQGAEERRFATHRVIDAAGRIKTLEFQLPDGTESASYHYDSASRVSRIDWTAGNKTSSLFEAQEIDTLGRYRSVLLGNGVVEQREYADAGQRLLQSSRVVTTGKDYQHVYAARDAEGRITQLNEVTWHKSWWGAFPQTVANGYSYDTLDRLSAVTGPKAASYTYDPLGNLTSRAVNGQSTVTQVADLLDPDRIASTHIDGITREYTYDGAGNIVRNGATGTVPFGTPVYQYTYDAANRAVGARKMQGFGVMNASMVWDGTGGLASLEVAQGSFGTSNILFQERRYGKLITERWVANTNEWQLERTIPGPLGVLALIRTGDSDNETLYPHGDHRGTRIHTDSSGAVTQLLDYSPFGTVTNDTGDVGSFDYSAKQFNYGTTLADLGVTLLGPRFYDPTTGRFLQRDPIIFSGAASKGNPYSFSFNDPINWSDPSGLSPESDSSMSPEAMVAVNLFWTGMSHMNKGYDDLKAKQELARQKQEGIDIIVDRLNSTDDDMERFGKIVSGVGMFAVGFGLCATVVGCIVGVGGIATAGADLAASGVTGSDSVYEHFGGELGGSIQQNLAFATNVFGMFMPFVPRPPPATYSGPPVFRPDTKYSQHQQYLSDLREKMVQPYTQDPALTKILNGQYRPGATVGSGSTAAAVREEVTKFTSVRGKDHTQKAQDTLNELSKWLRNNPTARPGDRAAAENVMLDLLNALEWK